MENVSLGGAPHGLPHSALAGKEAEIDALRETGTYFFQRGWSVGTSSNYSVVLKHDPLQLLLTASGMDKGRLTRADFVRVNDQGHQVDIEGAATTDQPKSSAETLLHVVAAGQPGVGSILHTHSIWGTLLSDYFFDEGGFAIEGYEMLKGLSGVKTHEHAEWVPVFDNTQDIPVLAEQVAARLSDQSQPPIHGYLIRRHGLYTWGADVAEARRHIEIYEFLFETLVRRMLLCGELRSAASAV
ncbi:methylthioribulose 1-phosphate dehydratase [Blastopirellula sp. J2-11]|uniref:methylthioribulose 1-phosphate dehydratase n=1 Tax=Blastopirellula sp. J2-11 TaxID=2943192 RepID=UPI0021CA0BE9|nr:methylthioribulose 1-phosphate dehydratase [Blastopirellula sp. J2-11]UUO08196.1 methylthioribulose 1-phosphate dehydratase [Blastopirellula sp. J2-11]